LRLAALLVALMLPFVLPRGALAQEQETPYVVAAGQRVAGSVSTISRDIRVEGVVEGDVTSWSGDITIAGIVGGDVVSYGGTVTVAATGRVSGHVLASGGELRLATGAAVAGQTINGDGGGALASLLDLFMPAADAAGIGPVGRALFAGALGVLLAAFCLLYTAFWPRRILLAGATLRRLPARALALGLLTTVALGMLLVPLVAMLVASVVGLPLLLPLLALALASYVYGLTVLAGSAGAWVSIRAGLSPSQGNLPAIAALALVLLIVAVAALAPLWGLALFCVLASPGLGAAILSRGGMAAPLVAR
jgi:hypothetical protein